MRKPAIALRLRSLAAVAASLALAASCAPSDESVVVCGVVVAGDEKTPEIERIGACPDADVSRGIRDVEVRLTSSRNGARVVRTGKGGTFRVSIRSLGGTDQDVLEFQHSDYAGFRLTGLSERNAVFPVREGTNAVRVKLPINPWLRD